MNDWEKFNEHFAEDYDERNERLRKARIAARCQACGVGNDKIGKTHAPNCTRAPK